MDIQKNNLRPLIAGLLGLMIALLLGYLFLNTPAHLSSHPVGTSHDEVVHVHGDFKMYIGDDRIRFTDSKYQSTTGHAHHSSLHFHDGNDEVIHRHANNVTLVEFFDSIGMKLTNDCLTLDTGKTYCTEDLNTLMLLVNNERTMDIENYVFAEEDRILVYYGDPTNPKIRDYVVSVTDMACMYSGTCTERGTPPTEGCGLTCEIATEDTNGNIWLTSVKSFLTSTKTQVLKLFVSQDEESHTSTYSHEHSDADHQ